MNGLRNFVLTNDANSERLELSSDIPEGATLILKQARFETTYTGDNYPRHLNVSIGSTVSNTFIVNNDGKNYFKVGLDYNPQTIGGTKYNISVTYPDAGYTVSGRINRTIQVNILDEDGNPFFDLEYYFLQFSIV